MKTGILTGEASCLLSSPNLFLSSSASKVLLTALLMYFFIRHTFMCKVKFLCRTSQVLKQKWGRIETVVSPLCTITVDLFCHIPWPPPSLCWLWQLRCYFFMDILSLLITRHMWIAACVNSEHDCWCCECVEEAIINTITVKFNNKKSSQIGWVMKPNWFTYRRAELRCSLQVKCGPLSVCFCPFQRGSLNLPESTCLHFLRSMTAVCSIYERLAGNILYPGGSHALWNSHHSRRFGNHR